MKLSEGLRNVLEVNKIKSWLLDASFFNFYLLCTSDRSGLWSTGCRVVCRILGVKNENHNPMHFPLGQDHEGGFSWSCSERGATVFIVSVLK